ncbi:hypothetical protein KCV01_g13670, partial [Aureobasidium melanogenum]
HTGHDGDTRAQGYLRQHGEQATRRVADARREAPSPADFVRTQGLLGEQEGFAGQRLGAQGTRRTGQHRRGQAHRQPRESDVDTAFFQQVRERIHRMLRRDDGHVGPGITKSLDLRLQDARERGRTDIADLYTPQFTPSRTLAYAAGPLELRDGQPGLLEEGFAGRRQRDAAARSDEQARVQVALQFLDLHRQRRGGDIQPLGRPGEMQLLGRSDEVPEMSNNENEYQRRFNALIPIPQEDAKMTSTSPTPPDIGQPFVLDTDRVAIFDLDGTLVDSVEGMTLAVNRLLRTLRAPPLVCKEAAAFLGHGLETLARRACQFRGVMPTDEDIRHFVDDYRLDPLTGTRLYSGVANTLSALAQDGWRLAVCTNKTEDAALTILGGLDVLGYFDVVCGGDAVETPKPDPRHLDHALRLGGLHHLPSVMIGDNAVDVAAADSYGIPCIFASWGYGQAPARPGDLCVARRFTELPSLLEGLLPSSRPGA